MVYMCNAHALQLAMQDTDAEKLSGWREKVHYKPANCTRHGPGTVLNGSVLGVCTACSSMHPTQVRCDVCTELNCLCANALLRCMHLCMLQALSFIKHAETLEGRVLVHCVAGCSRSAAIVLLHLMAAHGKQT
jgi:Dual specificity phosphatase, catalytic domain